MAKISYYCHFEDILRTFYWQKFKISTNFILVPLTTFDQADPNIKAIFGFSDSKMARIPWIFSILKISYVHIKQKGNVETWYITNIYNFWWRMAFLIKVFFVDFQGIKMAKIWETFYVTQFYVHSQTKRKTFVWFYSCRQVLFYYPFLYFY